MMAFYKDERIELEKPEKATTTSVSVTVTTNLLSALHLTPIPPERPNECAEVGNAMLATERVVCCEIVYQHSM